MLIGALFYYIYFYPQISYICPYLDGISSKEVIGN